MYKFILHKNDLANNIDINYRSDTTLYISLVDCEDENKITDMIDCLQVELGGLAQENEIKKIITIANKHFEGLYDELNINLYRLVMQYSQYDVVKHEKNYIINIGIYERIQELYNKIELIKGATVYDLIDSKDRKGDYFVCRNITKVCTGNRVNALKPLKSIL